MCVASKVCTRPVSVLTETRSQNRRETRAKRVLKLLYVSHTKENAGTETDVVLIERQKDLWKVIKVIC